MSSFLLGGTAQAPILLACRISSSFRPKHREPIPFTTYAQDREDLILFHALAHVRKGFYVDVGASSPSTISVTKAFYLMGWHGINIEPLHGRHKELVRARPRDINLNIGCGAEHSYLNFWERDRFSTMNAERRTGPPTRVVEVFPLLDVVVNYSVKVCHFCKIDVEGFEKNVLQGIDWNAFRPWTFCIEATLPGTGIPCHDQWEFILLANGYKLGCAYGINRYYYDARLHPELSEGLIGRRAFHVYNIRRE